MDPPRQIQGCGTRLRSSSVVLPSWLLNVALIIAHVVSAILNVMSMYHDTLLAKVAHTDPKYKPLLPSSPHTRYTRAWCDKDARYKWAARALEMIRFIELLLEMGLRRKVSRKTRWRGIVMLEVVKCVPSFCFEYNPHRWCSQSAASPCFVAYHATSLGITSYPRA